MSETCTVVSIAPIELNEFKPGLHPSKFHIRESIDENPQFLHVDDGFHYVYIDEDRGSLRVPDLASSIARSVVEDCTNAQMQITEDARPGLFWLPQKVISIAQIPKPTLAEAKRVQRNWFMELCKVADNDWNKYHNHFVIADLQRKVARLIGWSPEEHIWMIPESKTSELTSSCPACLSKMHPEAVICAICRTDKRVFKKELAVA